MKRKPDAGYSLLELMIVLIIGAIILGVTVPAFKAFTKSSDLKNAASQIVTQLTLAREKAISSGSTQTVRFIQGFQGDSDYHVWNPPDAFPKWKLPKGVTYNWGAGTQNTFRLTNDGRCLDSGMIILQNEAGIRDTISVRLSGLILVY